MVNKRNKKINKFFNELTEESKEKRKKYFEEINLNKPITFIDTSEYSKKNYTEYTNNIDFFWDNDQKESVPFGYIGIKKNIEDNFCFIDIKACNWLTFEEKMDAVLNSFHRCFYSKYFKNEITKDTYFEMNREVNEKKHIIENEIKHFLIKF